MTEKVNEPNKRVEWLHRPAKPYEEHESEMCPELLATCTKDTLEMEQKLWKGQVEKFTGLVESDEFWAPYLEDAVKRLKWVDEALAGLKKKG